VIQQPWKPSGGEFSLGESPFFDPISTGIALAIRHVWEVLPQTTRTLDQVEAKLRAILREEAERVASAGFLDGDRVLIRNAVCLCAQFRPEGSAPAGKLEQMVLPVLEAELRKAREDAGRHGVE
jgi:hypothetical protein